MSRNAYKSVASCPECGHRGLTLKTKRESHTTDDEDYVLHYSECPKCGTRCKTETTTRIISRGVVPAEVTPLQPNLI